MIDMIFGLFKDRKKEKRLMAREIAKLKIATTGLLTLNDFLRDTLEKVREDMGLCIVCGNPSEDKDEYCNKCYRIETDQLFEELRHPDDSGRR